MTKKQEEDKVETGQLDVMDPVKLISVADNIQGNMMEALLNSIGIKVYRRALEGGGAMQAYMGYSIYGEDLYVDKADYEQALAIVEQIENVSEEELEAELEAEFAMDQSAETDKDEIDRVDHSSEIRRWFRYVAIIMIVFTLLGLMNGLPTWIKF